MHSGMRGRLTPPLFASEQNSQHDELMSSLSGFGAYQQLYGGGRGGQHSGSGCLFRGDSGLDWGHESNEQEVLCSPALQNSVAEEHLNGALSSTYMNLGHASVVSSHGINTANSSSSSNSSNNNNTVDTSDIYMRPASDLQYITSVPPQGRPEAQAAKNDAEKHVRTVRYVQLHHLHSLLAYKFICAFP